MSGFGSVSGGKWHRTYSDEPTFTHDEQSLCGRTFRPLNVVWPPDYPRAHPAHLCSKCFSEIERESALARWGAS